jgi:hypothetical protein
MTLEAFNNEFTQISQRVVQEDDIKAHLYRQGLSKAFKDKVDLYIESSLEDLIKSTNKIKQDYLNLLRQKGNLRRDITTLFATSAVWEVTVFMLATKMCLGLCTILETIKILSLNKQLTTITIDTKTTITQKMIDTYNQVWITLRTDLIGDNMEEWEFMRDKQKR